MRKTNATRRLREMTAARRCSLAGALVAALSILFASGTAAAEKSSPAIDSATLEDVLSPDDRVFAELEKELSRNESKLEIPKEPKPYYMGLSLTDAHSWWIAASLGSLITESTRRSRSLQGIVRVGSMKLDNTGYYSPYPRAQHQSVPNEHDGLSLRRGAHKVLDRSYKHALRQLSRKKAYLQSHPQDDRPDDWTKIEAKSFSRPGKPMTIQPSQWRDSIKKVSAVFRSHPKIFKSRTAISTVHMSMYGLTSESARFFRSGAMTTFSLTAHAQAKDGMKLYSAWRKQVVSRDEMVTEKVLLEAAKRVARELESLLAAPKMEENYSGPVLFEGQAAAQLVFATIGANAAANEPPVALRSSRAVFEGMLGRKILPAWMTVIDDPTLKKYRGKKLAGYYRIDDEGVPAQKVTIVKRGKLKAFLASRRPSKDAKKSNGHGRALLSLLGTIAAPSNLIVKSRRRLSAKALERKLIKLLRQKGLDHGYIVKRTAQFRPYSLLRPGSRNLRLPQPLLLYRIDLKGKKTLVRGAKFESLPASELERIQAMGGRPKVHNMWLRPGTGASVITQNIIMDRVELTEKSRRRTRYPILPSPLEKLTAAP
jgi:hypothetical protein